MKRILKLAVSLLYYALVLAPLRALDAIRGRRRPRLLVLYYHGVPAGQRAAFGRQMDALLKAGRPASADPEAPRPPNGRHVAVTFDDACASILDNALPELAARGIPATVFVPSGNLGRKPEWDIAQGSSGHNDRVMKAEELKDLVESSVTIGSHTVSHAPLAALSDNDALNELSTSKESLEKLLGRAVELVAFPYGIYTSRTAELARKAGYRHAYTIEGRTAAAGSAEFLVGRFQVSPGDWPIEFWLKARGAYEWLAHLRRARAEVTG